MGRWEGGFCKFWGIREIENVVNNLSDFSTFAAKAF